MGRVARKYISLTPPPYTYTFFLLVEDPIPQQELFTSALPIKLIFTDLTVLNLTQLNECSVKTISGEIINVGRCLLTIPCAQSKLDCRNLIIKMSKCRYLFLSQTSLKRLQNIGLPVEEGHKINLREYEILVLRNYSGSWQTGIPHNLILL